MTRLSLHLANSATPDPAELILPNDYSQEEDGWAQLAPYCDKLTEGTPTNLAAFRARFPGVRVDGAGRVAVIQRVDKTSAVAMANEFNGLGGKVRRFFRGAPIFSGHPDMPGMAARYPDATPKGMVMKIEARETGLYCLPVFNDAGAEMVNSGTKLGFSGRWVGEPIAEENGRLVYRPVRFISVGLTDNPNLPVEFLNTDTTVKITELVPLIAGLKLSGITLSDEATDDQIKAAFTVIGQQLNANATLANEKTTLTSERDSLKAERDRLATDLSNEKAARITDKVTLAVADGRITEAEKSLWISRLTANFANEGPALDAIKPQFKTAAATDGARKNAAAQPAQEGLINLANEKLRADPGLGWDGAWAAACKAQPAWFEALKAPPAA